MANHRHKRDTEARRPKAIYIAGPLAIAATVSAVSLGVLTATPDSSDFFAAANNASATTASNSSLTTDREEIVSRSQSRQQAAKAAKREARQAARQQAKQEAKQEAKLTRAAIRSADTRKWATTELNVWSAPGKQADQLGVIEDAERVLLTGRRENGRVEVVVNNKSRWVTAGYFADTKPETGPTMVGTCTNGSSISAGSPSLYDIHNVVCANWPQITSYGTWRSDGEHGQGRAIDIMVSGETGWEIANFLRENYADLGIEYIIYAQQIWSVERGGEGWRGMSDRGSITANHYDHVHVTVY